MNKMQERDKFNTSCRKHSVEITIDHVTRHIAWKRDDCPYCEIDRLKAELEEWKLQSARKRATAHEAKDYEAAISVWKCRAEEAERQLAEAKREIDVKQRVLDEYYGIAGICNNLTNELAEARAEIEQYKGCLQLLSSIWYHGDFVVETYNEARLCELMKSLGFWPYKEKFKLEGCR